MEKVIETTKQKFINKTNFALDSISKIRQTGLIQPYNQAHLNLVNSMLEGALPELQIELFQTILIDISILEYTAWEMKNSEEKKPQLNEEYLIVKTELEAIMGLLANLNIESFRLEQDNKQGFENLWYFLLERAQKAYGTSYISDANNSKIIQYSSLVHDFLQAYVTALNELYIKVFKKAQDYIKDNNKPSIGEEDPLFFTESNNFFILMLRHIADLNYNYYDQINTNYHINQIQFFTTLLNLIAKIYNQTITKDELTTLEELIKGKDFLTLGITSYYSQWLNDKIIVLREKFSR